MRGAPKRPSEEGDNQQTRDDRSTVSNPGQILPRILIDGLEAALKRGEPLEDTLTSFGKIMARHDLDGLLDRMLHLGRQQLRVVEAERRQQAVQAALKRGKDP